TKANPAEACHSTGSSTVTTIKSQSSSSLRLEIAPELTGHGLPLGKWRAAEQHRADVARARRAWPRQQGLFDITRLVFIDELATSINMVRLRFSLDVRQD